MGARAIGLYRSVLEAQSVNPFAGLPPPGAVATSGACAAAVLIAESPLAITVICPQSLIGRARPISATLVPDLDLRTTREFCALPQAHNRRTIRPSAACTARSTPDERSRLATVAARRDRDDFCRKRKHEIDPVCAIAGAAS